jgi:CRISPR-associated protein Csy1
MIDKEINNYLENKIQDFIKKKTKESFNEEEKLVVENEAKDKFFLNNWLIDASGRAVQLSLTTHPPKLSHPDAKIDTIIANCEAKNDGYVRSGNIEVELDIVGNAASLDVYKFLYLQLENNLTILENLEKNTDYIKKQFSIDNYNEVRDNFLKIKKLTPELKTNDKVKQIYFPVGDNYHLLSLLTPSPIVYRLKQSVNNIKFSKTNEEARESLKRENTDFSGKIEDVWNLTQIGYGGTKPQNISVINNKNGGVAYLLNSVPPTLDKRKTQPPKKNFFKTNIWLSDYLTQDFKDLYQMLKSIRNNKKIRDKRDLITLNIMLKIKRDVDRVREIGIGWSDSPSYDDLDKWQKILLDNKYINDRNNKESNNNFLEKTKEYFAKWFILTYDDLFDIKLADGEIIHIKGVIEDEMEVFL